jgi:hypothetical protein
MRLRRIAEQLCGLDIGRNGADEGAVYRYRPEDQRHETSYDRRRGMRCSRLIFTRVGTTDQPERQRTGGHIPISGGSKHLGDSIELPEQAPRP